MPWMSLLQDGLRVSLNQKIFCVVEDVVLMTKFVQDITRMVRSHPALGPVDEAISQMSSQSS